MAEEEGKVLRVSCCLVSGRKAEFIALTARPFDLPTLPQRWGR